MLRAICESHAKGQNRLLCKAPTGTGKTTCFAALPRWPAMKAWLEGFPTNERKMLVIAHREELLHQARARISGANPGLIVDIEQADLHANRYSDVVIASIQTLSAMKFRRMHRLLAKHRFRIVIVDECFPPGTLVDGRPIETLRVGESVTAFDPATLALSSQRIVRVLSKTASSLVRIHTDHGPLVCTPTHKIWTCDGWARAAAVAVGCMIGHHADASKRYLPCVRVPGSVDDQTNNRHLAPVDADVLHEPASRPMVRAGILSPDGQDQSPLRVRTHEGAESNEVRGHARENEIDPAREKTSTHTPGRQRAARAIAATSSGGSVGVADRSDPQDRTRLPASPLQTRHREPGAQDRDRSGRRQSPRQRATGAGRAEGHISTWARVDRVEVLESGRDGEFERLCPGGRVYDLEVEGLHTYIANGFAVSNCHHAAAASYRTALVHLGFLPPADASDSTEIEAVEHDDVAVMTKALENWELTAPKDQLLIGVTATPNRSDAIGLGCVFQSITYSYDLKKAIDDGYLVPITPWVIESKTSLDDVRTSHGDFNQKDLAEAVNQEIRNRLAVAGWREHADGLSTIAFTVDVAHAHALAAEFRAAGVAAVAISGETPKDERRDALRRYTAGEITVLSNCAVFLEGVDLPRTACVLMARPTQSATLYEQAVGRGLRQHPGKTACVVIDLVDVCRRHSLQTAPVLYGLPPGLIPKGQTLTQLDHDLAAFLALNPRFDLDATLKRGRFTLEQLAAVATRIDVWQVQPLGTFGVGLTLDWIRTSEEVFRLQYPWGDGAETLQIAKDLIGTWEISLTLRPSGGGGIAGVRQRTLAANIETADAAAVLAEAFISQERRQVVALKDKEAPWKARPASEKQLALLRRLGVAHTPKMTMGQASNLIDLARARRAR